jgi:hypothetical protein
VVDGFEIQPNKQADKSEYLDIHQGVEEITHGWRPFLILVLSTGRQPAKAR